MKTAIVFAGQGAQFIGMGADLFQQPVCSDLTASARRVLDFDVVDICLNGPEERLTASDVAQPAIFLVSALCWQALKQTDMARPACVAGLSLGEWTALYAAGVVSFEDCLRILQARGRFMQDACELKSGAMLSVMGMKVSDVELLAGDCDIEVANYNSPQQTVLSGTPEGVAKAAVLARERGAKLAVPLKVAGAFHSSFMQDAADKLAGFLDGICFNEPMIPVLSNVTGCVFKDAAEIKSCMVQQVTSSVRWTAEVQTMLDLDVTRIIECGPGKVLTGLIKRIDRSVHLANVQSFADIEQIKE